jgi:hypothetical protein
MASATPGFTPDGKATHAILPQDTIEKLFK